MLNVETRALLCARLSQKGFGADRLRGWAMRESVRPGLESVEMAVRAGSGPHGGDLVAVELGQVVTHGD